MQKRQSVLRVWKRMKKERQSFRQSQRHATMYQDIPQRTFQEAIQSFYFYHLAIFMEQNAAAYNPGRMDQYFYPYYKADIESGRITPDEGQELLECLWVNSQSRVYSRMLQQQDILQDTRCSRHCAVAVLMKRVKMR